MPVRSLYRVAEEMRSLSKVYKSSNVELHHSLPYILENFVETENNNDVLAENESVNSENDEIHERVNNILEDAYNKAEEIINQANIQANVLKEEIFEESKKNGYNAGYADGYKDGLENARKEYQGIITQAQQELIEAQQRKDAAIKEAEMELVNLAIDIAREVLDHEIATNEDVIVHLVNKAIKSYYSAGPVCIRVCEEDYSVLTERIGKIIEAAGENINFEILKDDNVKKGMCLLETPNGIIDASIDKQMDKIAKELRLMAGISNE